MILGMKRASYLLNVHKLSLFPQTYLPSKFKILETGKFNGTRCSSIYLMMYIRALQPIGVSKDLMVQLFQQTLTGTTLRWFLSFKDSKTQIWEDIYMEFNKQYKYNTKVDITKKDLETTKR